ncbi:MerR family DNA-binding transcriptional regulator [Actinokineospora bangkokensis]|uniref:MerR family transcriptional regulator n=1 Tax=Actinokineospora bangkokensis TaxID=1193682 RepID=A0A1Q9LRD0_9PSEU|nr:MerR family DNA-binding transcriptional regulator [Actinokineospora bangkokensis]OLR94563.1 MerR family transcriptional regulator [Actinokineospora bangkokensis]
MRIGELAKRAGTTARAVRFYEAQGLLDPAERAANGYREYGEGDLRLVSEILSLQAAGLSLEETRPFVACLRAGHEAGDDCADSVAVYRRKIAELDAVAARLAEVRAGLVDLLSDALAREPGPCRVDAGRIGAVGPTAE